MVDPTSRYRSLVVYDTTDADGRGVPTIAIRYVDPARPDLLRHRVSAAETLEYISWKAFQNSARWWRIADVNGLRFPLEWVPGETLAMPSAEDVGRIERTRSF